MSCGDGFTEFAEFFFGSGFHGVVTEDAAEDDVVKFVFVRGDERLGGEGVENAGALNGEVTDALLVNGT